MRAKVTSAGGARRAACLFMAAFSLAAGGCDDDVFRETANPQIQSGLASVLGALVDGAFAAFQVGADQTETPAP